MKRTSLKRNINKFLKRYNKIVTFEKYKSTPDQQGAPYRQRKRKYENPTTIECAVVERRLEDEPSPIGDNNLRRFDVCTGSDQLIKAFHPLNYDDPRLNIDPSVIIDKRDRIQIDGVICNILHITRHGDDGNGPLWFVMRCEETLE